MLACKSSTACAPLSATQSDDKQAAVGAASSSDFAAQQSESNTQATRKNVIGATVSSQGGDT